MKNIENISKNLNYGLDNINLNNHNKIVDNIIFCTLYQLYRDFDLRKRCSKAGTLSWKQAESISDLCNTLIKIRQASPDEFIKTEDETSNELITKYNDLKEGLNIIKDKFGPKKKNQLLRAVKTFYRKRSFCYEMDCYYCLLSLGVHNLMSGYITKDQLIEHYFCKYSLFTGKRTNLSLKEVVRVYSKINNTIQNSTDKYIKI